MRSEQARREPEFDKAELEKEHETTVQRLAHIDNRRSGEEGWYGAWVTDRPCPRCEVGVVVRSNSTSTPPTISSKSCSANCGWGDSDL